ncbi:glycosyltransferase [Pseudomonas sp.]|uniref:glycosyltransferase n=1 Tax=Pseudomonas sp. TaxID=306 RepID=UPI0026093149|nr:glycosyltransferase [Pseudomonas sp.]
MTHPSALVSAATGSAGPRLPVWRGLLHPTTLVALAVTAAAAFGAWSWHEQPVTPPDFNGRVAGLAFSPYHAGESGENGKQPTTAEIKSDLAMAAAQTGHIRLYTVAGEFADIPHLAEGTNLKITLGAWLDRKAADNAAELSRLIRIANQNPNVERLMVGNETQYRGDLSLPQLIADITKVKAATHVPVSTAEPPYVWLRHPELVSAVDQITVHLLPYWNGTPIKDAMPQIMGWYTQLQHAYPNKPIVVGEVGWPSNGVTLGGAVASRENQAMFLRSFFNVAAQRHIDNYFVMEAFDQPWKTPFEGMAAGYWGMMDQSRHAKWSMTGSVTEDQKWLIWAGISVAMAVIASGLLLSRRPDISLPGKLMFAGLAQSFSMVLARVLLAMNGQYLTGGSLVVWSALAAGQALLIMLLLADSFEMAEAIFGRVWRRIPNTAPVRGNAPLPKVSIHIPICNEPPHMVKLTLDALAEMDYPSFEVLVIDNNTKDPALWEPVAEHCARLGARFRFFHLGKWPGFKAGALNFAMRETASDAEVVGVIDSDYIVSRDWLRSMTPHFANPLVGFAQSPQDYRDNDGSFFKRLMFWEYAGFFQNGMVTRNERNAVIQHGTMTLVRKSALQGVNGWAEWTICEDSELGLRLMRGGWEGVYSAQSFGKGVMPDDFAAFRKQRFRWAYGAMQICRGHMKALFSPATKDLTLGQRWHFVMGWLPWVGDGLGLVFLLMGLAWSLGIIINPIRFVFPIALFMLPSLGLFTFKLVQIFSLYSARVKCGWADRLGAAVAGLALSHTIGKAVLKGLVIRTAPFLRTPKMENAPALVQGLVMAREELVLMVATWAALIGVALVTHLGSVESKLWCLVLFTQSLPYVASVFVAVMAALPARVKALSPAAVPEKNGLFASGD